ncbi:MAG: Hint domain-containing protein, partial [Paracoccaceae bacterium]|nr:Hint domain-containing protein [Paracoccaceae bacterium]
IVGIIVYDNAGDYFNDIAKYTYVAQTPDDQVYFDTSRAGMGDTYLTFDASSLTSSDLGAPVLGDMVIGAGENLTGAIVDGGQNPYDISKISDGGDGFFSSADIEDLVVICFAAGTLIDAETGGVPVELLAEGDRVRTLDDGLQPIRWIGHVRVPAKGEHAPIRIRAGAMGNVRDLFLSPNHRILVRGAMAELLFGEEEVLVAAKHLVNDATIRREPCETIDYYHFLLDRHSIVFAEGCPAESLYPGEYAQDVIGNDTAGELRALFPDLVLEAGAEQLTRRELRRFEAEVLQPYLQ